MKTEDYSQFIEHAWYEQTARNSLERWVDVCNKEKWKISDESMEKLIRIFGASWYFTRFIFVYGEKINDLLEITSISEIEKYVSGHAFDEALNSEELEDAINHLRMLKNSVMFMALVTYLTETSELEELESVLTKLSEKILLLLIQVMEKETNKQNIPITVLGMGRMAGYEMTFGSDLDLIFLYEKDEQMLNPELSSIVRLLLRLVAQPSAYGQLYEVDMRLRPHGSSGPLVTTYDSFLNYHASDREIWERQMMTRCRPVVVKGNNVEPVMENLKKCIFKKYDEVILKKNIISMRRKVEKVLGKVKGKYEIKRGAGGLMDIDFITHYYQLLHGVDNAALQTCSTRQGIRELKASGYIDEIHSSELLQGYNYLKRMEASLRLFDLKSVDTFSIGGDSNVPLSRAMGFGNDTTAFMEKFIETTMTVRKNFSELVGV